MYSKCRVPVSLFTAFFFFFLLCFLVLPGNFLLEEISAFRTRCSFNPFDWLLLGAQRGVLQCLGTHLEGPLDASTSPVRQQALQPVGLLQS